MEFSAFQSFNLAILVLFTGKFLNMKVGFLREFNIPEPVTGGLLFALLFTGIHFVTGEDLIFDMDPRDTLLVYFFTAIGLNARFSMLLQGGKSLVVLLLATLFYMAIQNVTGISVAQLTGQSPYVGLLGGTVSLIGGHGTSIAWAPTFQSEYGVQNAVEIGIACATFGLVLASLMGGPIAKYLINRNELEPPVVEEPDIGLLHSDTGMNIDYMSVLYSLLILNIAIAIGWSVNEALEEAGLKMPTFVTCLFAGILLTNVYPEKMRLIPRIFKDIDWPSGSRSLALISDLSLGIFLAMSLMSLQLWVLIDLAGPILAILSAQFAIALLFNIFIIFNIMGRDYEAAVVSSGFGGISLGSTPTAIANMTAVTKKYGAAHKAFIVVPLVSAFFMDLANAFYIKFFLNLFR